MLTNKHVSYLDPDRRYDLARIQRNLEGLDPRDRASFKRDLAEQFECTNEEYWALHNADDTTLTGFATAEYDEHGRLVHYEYREDFPNLQIAMAIAELLHPTYTDANFFTT